jgi:hypothetical protein
MDEDTLDRQIVRRNPSWPWCDLGTEIVVLRTEDDAYYRLEAGGRALWLALESPQTVRALVTRLAAEFDGLHARIDKETRDFIVRCREFDLVILADG